MQDRKYIEYDLKDFINGKKNILFITGYMGSGKSTLAKEFGKRYNAISFSLDNVFDWNSVWTTVNRNNPEQILYFQLLKNSKAYRDLGDGIGSFNPEFKNASVTEKCAWIIKEAIKDCSKENRIIIEGVQLYHYDELFPIFINYPLVIMDLNTDEARKSDEMRDKSYGIGFWKRFLNKNNKKDYYINQYDLFTDFLNRVRKAKGEKR